VPFIGIATVLLLNRWFPAQAGRLPNSESEPAKLRVWQFALKSLRSIHRVPGWAG
jgi:hypothetical protein